MYAAHLQVAGGEMNKVSRWNLEGLYTSLIGGGNVDAVVGPLRMPMEPTQASIRSKFDPNDLLLAFRFQSVHVMDVNPGCVWTGGGIRFLFR